MPPNRPSDPPGQSLFGTFEPARTVRIPEYPFEHEVRVWLPPTYAHTDRSYPTLWALDNAVEIASVALTGASYGLAPELVVVGVGGSTSLSHRDFQSRRVYDFFPEAELIRPDVLGEL